MSDLPPREQVKRKAADICDELEIFLKAQLGDIFEFSIIREMFEDMRGASEFEAEDWI